jgi:hypothetical protein
LFKGFILHDGSYNDFLANDLLRNFHTKIPMLLLQNFDDDRVTVDNVLNFYKKLTQGGTSSHKIKLFITPQGASSAKQEPAISAYKYFVSSTNGHFVPEFAKYATEYFDSISNFLESSMEANNYRSRLNQLRHRYTQTLLNAGQNDRTILYRLYYAQLHAETQDITASGVDSQNKMTMEKRMQSVFSLYAHQLSSKEKSRSEEQIYQDLVNEHGLWLISEVLTKMQDLFKSVTTGLRTKRPPQIQASTTSNSSLQRATITKENLRHFYLTEEARHYLKQHKNAVEIIERAKEYSVVIDLHVAQFFENKHDPLTIDDVKRLWDIKDFPSNEPDLMISSRTFSLIRKMDLTVIEQLRLFNSVTHWDPLGILFALGNSDLKVENYEYLMDILLKREAPERTNIVRNLSKLILEDDYNVIIDWVANLNPMDRDKIVRNYIIARETVDKMDNKDELLKLLRSGNELQE